MLNKVDNYINSMLDPINGLYKFNSRGNATLLSTDFAILVKYLLGQTFDSKLKEKLIESTLKHKMEDNSFIDCRFDSSVERYHKPDYTINQFTFFTLIALDHMNYRLNSLDFFYRYLDPQEIKKWFEQIDWKCFWYESNKIMFYIYFYAYIIAYGEDLEKLKAEECIELVFTILNAKQDKNTGYWGTDLNGNDLVDGCFGAAHILLFYEFFNKDIQYLETIIDSTLSLHSQNSLILSLEGGACEDYDAVELYLRVLKHTDYRKQDIINHLESMREVILEKQNRNGGFPYRFWEKQKPFQFKPPGATYMYSSWDTMESRIYYPDLWGTYFRLLTVAAIEKILKYENDYQSYHLPGWGYL
jgi:hypothetical protein